MTRGCLYRLTFPNGKLYIGITKRLVAERFYEHCKSSRNGSSYAVHRAIRKYGASEVMVETLAVARWSYLTGLESRAIVAFNTKGGCGYNLTNGGEGVPGRIVSELTRAKMRAAHKGRKRGPLSAETREKIGAARRGIKATPEQRARQSAAQKGRYMSEPNRAALLAANLGRARTDAEKVALRAARKGKALSAEHRAKLSAAKKGKPVNAACLAAAAISNRNISAATIAKRNATRVANIAAKADAKPSGATV